MAEYMRRPEMFDGGPFHCPNCGKKMAVKLKGSSYEAAFQCPRCRCYIYIRTREPIPFVEKMRGQKAEKKQSIGTTP